MSVGERIRSIRTEQKLTVKELSKASGVPDKTIYRIETGEVEDPRMSSITALIRALNCSADEVIFDSKDFPRFSRLRQALLNFTEMEENQQDFLMDVMEKLSFSMAMERHVGQNLASMESDEK